MKLLKKIDKNLERWVMFLLLAGMTLVLGIQIFCRFVLNNSLTWSEELARFMFIWSTFLSIGFCSLFPKKVQAVILLLGDVVMTVFFLYLLPSAWEFAYASVENGQTSAACGIPMYFVQGSLMVGFALAAFRAAQGYGATCAPCFRKEMSEYVSRGPFCPVFVILLFGLPISVTMGISSILPWVVDNTFAANLVMVLRQMMSGVNSLTLLAIPMFMLSGTIMARGGISKNSLTSLLISWAM